MSIITKSLLGLAAAAAIQTAASAAIVGITFYEVPLTGNAQGPNGNIAAVQKDRARTDDATSASATPVDSRGAYVAGPRYVQTMKTYDLAVIINGEDWTSTDLSLHLTAGQLYNFSYQDPDDLGATINDNVLQPAIWSTAPDRHARVDTAITAPGFTVPNLLGAYFDDGVNPPSTQPPAQIAFTPTDIHVSFGDLSVSANGLYTIARITATADAVGTGRGRVGGVGNQFNPAPYTFTLGPVPEPVSAGLLSVGFGILAIRRNRKA